MNPAVDENFQKGMAVFNAVKSYNIRYEIGPPERDTVVQSFSKSIGRHVERQIFPQVSRLEEVRFVRKSGTDISPHRLAAGTL
jgi:hypothetical protein